MPWQTETKIKILKYQAYEVRSTSVTSFTLSQLIDEQMADVEANNPDLIPIIEADLATLDSLDTALTTEEGSTNATLIKADVLAWSDTRSKTSGIAARFESIRSRIARMLSQSIDTNGGTSSGTWGVGTLERG